MARHKFTEEERKKGSFTTESGRDAQLLSADSRVERNTMRSRLRKMLSEKEQDVNYANKSRNRGIDDPIVLDTICVAQIDKACEGDTASATFVRDTMGEKPVDKSVDLNGVDANNNAMMAVFSGYESVSEKYKVFFASTLKERHIFLQGGRRSGKTFSTFKWLAKRGMEIGGAEIMVVCATFPQLQKTIQDFEDATGAKVSGSTTKGHCSQTFGGVNWSFGNFDDKTKAQGTKCDYLFINEAVNVDAEIAEVLMMGCRIQCVYNYNPTKKFWGNDYFNEKNLLCTKWSDNDYLTDEQRGEFEKLRERAERPNARRWDIYQYKVYYLGDFADMVGSVFGEIGKCEPDEYLQIPAKEVIGLDFGFATDGDPTTVVGVKVFENAIYIHEYIYEKGLTSNDLLFERMKGCGINEHTPVFADYGGQGRTRMDDLIRRKKMRIYNAVKGSIMDGISAMLTYERIVITRSSVATMDEFEAYELDSNGRPKGADHAIDAARYAFNYINKNAR